MGGISLWQILVILLVIVLLFGMGKLPSIAKELGKAIKGFRNSVDGSVEGDDASSSDASKLKKKQSKTGQPSKSGKPSKSGSQKKNLSSSSKKPDKKLGKKPGKKK